MAQACTINLTGSVKPELKSVYVKADIIGFTASVKITQSFCNNSSPVEATLSFYQPHAVLHDFIITLPSGKRILSKSKTRSRAFEKYDDAISSGKSAYLLEAGDVDGKYKLSLGNISPKEQISVMIAYDVPLQIEDDNRLSFVLPLLGSAMDATNTLTKDVANPSMFKEYKVEVDVDVKHIDKVTSPSHDIKTTSSSSGALSVVASWKENNAAAFKLDIGVKESLSNYMCHRARGIVGDKEEYALVLSGRIADKQKKEALTNMDFIFIIDRSGSMSGSRIQQAKNCLQLILRSLPQRSTFNIVSFGTEISSLFASSTQYNTESFTQATKHIEDMGADMGGTRILEPLTFAFDSKCEGLSSRKIFLLTDGDVSNGNEIVSLVNKRVTNSSFHCEVNTVGIDNAGKALVQRIADSGQGKCISVTNSERIEKPVMGLLQHSLKETVVRVDLCDITTKFESQGTVFMGTEHAARCILLKNMPENPQFVRIGEIKIPVDTSDVIESSSLVRIAVRNAIIQQSFLSGSGLSVDVVALAKRWHIITSETSLVGVDEETVRENTDAMKTQEIQKDIKVTNKASSNTVGNQSWYGWLFGKNGPTIREVKMRLKSEERHLKRELRKKEREEMKYKRDIKKAAKSNNINGARLFCRYLVGLRASKQDHLRAMAQIGKCTLEMHQSGKPSPEAIKLYDAIGKAGSMLSPTATMNAMSKSNLIDECMDDCMYDDDVEEETDELMHCVLDELSLDVAGGLVQTTMTSTSKYEQEQMDDELERRLANLSSGISHGDTINSALSKPSTEQGVADDLMKRLEALKSDEPKKPSGVLNTPMKPSPTKPSAVVNKFVKAKNPNVRKFDTFILAQDASGLFSDCESLYNVLGISKKEVVEKMKESGIEELSVWLTVVALYAFQSVFSQHKEESVLLVSKAQEAVHNVLGQDIEPHLSLASLLFVSKVCDK